MSRLPRRIRNALVLVLVAPSVVCCCVCPTCSGPARNYRAVATQATP